MADEKTMAETKGVSKDNNNNDKPKTVSQEEKLKIVAAAVSSMLQKGLTTLDILMCVTYISYHNPTVPKKQIA